jgi:hypothetical protein
MIGVPLLATAISADSLLPPECSVWFVTSVESVRSR